MAYNMLVNLEAWILQKKLGVIFHTMSYSNQSKDSLISLEDQLETALSATRARKTELTMEFVKMLQEKEELLREENLVLASQIDNTHIQRRGGTVGLARRTYASIRTYA
ncbi:PREDICTED: agamous-like MADS-box protein AGL27 isoform X3 [Brassica oleracea var. oleracea]|uniref:agamous-like MADS-box protein AGL27 isoform X3 n=1 Tax=Brassica oleracea var. oleracea TaxID=109376 RepID=UPI0006A6BD01|nr:PREDICTED: agamous-like MADS-box protein AGL27 isoform X3 [Brassica oleracea var. oleracea]